MKWWTLAAAALGFCLATTALADPSHPDVTTAHNRVELVPQTTSAAPGSTLYVALHQTIAPGWHTYWRNPGDAGQATSLDWVLPKGWTAGDIVWPAPEQDLTGPIMNYVLTGDVYLPTPVAIPADAKPGDTFTLKAAVSWLVCKDVCIPEDANLTLTLPVTGGTPAADPKFSAPITQTLADAPKPAGLEARYQLDGETLKLSVTGAAVRGADVAHAYFFAYDGAAVDHAKPQKAGKGADGLTLLVPAGYSYTHGKGPAHLIGVLSLGDHAYEIDATSGPALSGALGLAAPSATTPAPKGGGSSSAPSTGGASAGGVSFLTALASAFLGGLILNLMPCVFPVLSIKGAALARHIETPEKARGEGLAFLVGVLVSFLGLAVLLLAARAAGEAVGWGFQLQSPIVVALLCLIMLGSALNLSGVFEMGMSVQGVGVGLTQHSGLIGSFFTGVLAVVVAAPCTGPFMGAALGWGLVQPPLVAMSVILALGLGLALPFTALSFAPALFRRLPKPGAWMDTLRQVLAFPMYAAAAWLAWVFATQVGDAALVWLFSAALTLSFSAWCFGASQRADMTTGRTLIPRGFAAVALVSAVGFSLAGAKVAPSPAAAAPGSTASVGGLPTEPWSPARVAALQAQGKPVFVDFTAAWCVTCQVNERTALSTASVAQAFSRTGAVYLKADWTRRDAGIAQALAAQGRSGVPLYLVYGKSDQPKVLPQLLTPGLVVDAVNAAVAQPKA